MCIVSSAFMGLPECGCADDASVFGIDLGTATIFTKGMEYRLGEAKRRYYFVQKLGQISILLS